MAKVNLLQDILETAGHKCSQYSGRSMYGRTCLSVSLDKDMGEFYADIIVTLKDCVAAEGLASDEFDVVEEAFRNMRQDSMGRGTVLYWPSIPYVGEDEEDDDHVEGACADAACCTPEKPA